MAISVSMLGKFLTLIYSNIFSYTFFFSPLGVLIIWKLVHLMLPQGFCLRDCPHFFHFFHYSALLQSVILVLVPSSVLFLISVIVLFIQFSSVQSLSLIGLFATPWITARKTSLSIIISWSSLKYTSIESVMPSSHLILCRPLFNPSQHQSLFQWVNSLHEVAKVLGFQL